MQREGADAISWCHMRNKEARNYELLSLSSIIFLLDLIIVPCWTIMMATEAVTKVLSSYFHGNFMIIYYA